MIRLTDLAGCVAARVVDETQLRFFRLAVQQAEAGSCSDCADCAGTWNASACTKAVLTYDISYQNKVVVDQDGSHSQG